MKANQEISYELLTMKGDIFALKLAFDDLAT
jgi:hypothetical protein